MRLVRSHANCEQMDTIGAKTNTTAYTSYCRTARDSYLRSRGIDAQGRRIFDTGSYLYAVVLIADSQNKALRLQRQPATHLYVQSYETPKQLRFPLELSLSLN